MSHLTRVSPQRPEWAEISYPFEPQVFDTLVRALQETGCLVVIKNTQKP